MNTMYVMHNYEDVDNKADELCTILKLNNIPHYHWDYCDYTTNFDVEYFKDGQYYSAPFIAKNEAHAELLDSYPNYFYKLKADLPTNFQVQSLLREHKDTIHYGALDELARFVLDRLYELCNEDNYSNADMQHMIEVLQIKEDHTLTNKQIIQQYNGSHSYEYDKELEPHPFINSFFVDLVEDIREQEPKVRNAIDKGIERFYD